MKIGIDCRLAGMTGTGTGHYTLNIVSTLAKMDRKNAYVLVCSPGGRKKPLLKADNFWKLVLPDGHIMDSSWEQFELPVLLENEKIDLYFSPTGILPIVGRWKKVVTIHDIGFETHPQFYAEPLLQYLKKWIPLSVKIADRVIAVSDFTKRQLIKHYDVRSDKISVIYEAPSEIFRVTDDRKNLGQVKNKFHITGDYVLAVANLEPNKNIVSLVKGFAKVKTLFKNLKCVIVGNFGKASNNIRNVIADCNLGDSVILTGYVSDEELALLYNGAVCFIHSSLYEGFGLTPLEALACGTPVIASTAGALPEVLGDSPMYVDPPNEANIAEALRHILEDSVYRQERSERGSIRAKRYSWQKTAGKTLAVFDKLYNTPVYHKNLQLDNLPKPTQTGSKS